MSMLELLVIKVNKITKCCLVHCSVLAVIEDHCSHSQCLARCRWACGRLRHGHTVKVTRRHVEPLLPLLKRATDRVHLNLEPHLVEKRAVGEGESDADTPDVSTTYTTHNGGRRSRSTARHSSSFCTGYHIRATRVATRRLLLGNASRKLPRA